jgi:hypothetical protein
MVRAYGLAFLVDAGNNPKEFYMFGGNVLKRSVDSVLWQDYRAGDTGIVVHYSSDPVSEIAIREIPEEINSAVVPEPNYETGTYGLYGCEHPKIRSAFSKGKHRYLFFMTKYAGTNEQLRGSVIVTGYYRIVKTADAKKFHLRYCSEYGCLESEECVALRANEVHFVSLKDALVLDEAMLKEWAFTSKITRQTRIILDQEKTAKLLDHLNSKPQAVNEYIQETKRLQPHDAEEEASEEEEETAEKTQTQA